MLETSTNGPTVTKRASTKRATLRTHGRALWSILLDDVVGGRVPAKLYVFLNAWQLSAAGGRLCANIAGRLERVVLRPGMHDGNRTSLEAMRELTGFRLAQVTPSKAWASPTSVGRQLGLQSGFGLDGPVTPLFAAADATPAETLATYADGSAAVALRKTDDGWSLFTGAPGLTSDLLRIAARKVTFTLYRHRL